MGGRPLAVEALLSLGVVNDAQILVGDALFPQLPVHRLDGREGKPFGQVVGQYFKRQRQGVDAHLGAATEVSFGQGQQRGWQLIVAGRGGDDLGPT